MKIIRNILIFFCVVFSTATLGDLYETLSDGELGVFVSPESTDEELLQAYQQLIQQYPLDESDGSEMKARVLEIQKAWGVLGNPELREEYDLSLQNKEVSGAGDDSSGLTGVLSSDFLDEEEEEDEEPDCE